MYIIAELKWIFHSSGHAATSRYYIKVPTHWSHEVEVGPEKNLSFFVPPGNRTWESKTSGVQRKCELWYAVRINSVGDYNDSISRRL